MEIDRFFPSSKLCSNCGHKYQQLELSERQWTDYRFTNFNQINKWWEIVIYEN
ncbi:MAG: hypothetical protein QNJ70_27020 [Xenococcaceae cyanobacterium MO_207.B15]|nr:hypothetical protein [Xenococcaceae cyanobacterium MO_207.B15]